MSAVYDDVIAQLRALKERIHHAEVYL